MRTELIYALIDPTSREVRYVGRTSRTLKQRRDEHISAAKRSVKLTAVQAWIRSIKYRPATVLLQRVDVNKISNSDGRLENTASAAEIKWIKRFERSRLLNGWIDRECRAYKRLVNLA